MIYFDHAATSLPKPQCVVDAVVNAMQTFGNSGRGVHPSALAASRSLYDTRCKLAKLFHCASADHVIFTSNSTQALNTAIYGLLTPADHAISTDWEHNSVLRPLYDLQSQGMGLDFVPADQNGRLDLPTFEQRIRPNTKAIVCTHASNLTGDVLDIAAIGKMAHAHGILMIVDASQTAGARPIDMQAMHIDVLAFTGHKSLLGPQGTGGLCVAEGVEIRPLLRGGTGVQSHLKTQPSQMPTRLEAGTLNSHGLAGLNAAVDYLTEVGIEVIARKEWELMFRFYQGVKALDGVRIYGDFTADRAPIVTLNLRDYDSSAVADELAQSYGIATRPGAHCAPRLHQALGTTEQGAVRFSFGWQNTVEEVDAAVAALRELL